MTNALAALADTSIHSGPSPHRRFVFAVVVLGLLCVLCAPFFIDLVDHDAPAARGGVVDYASCGPLDIHSKKTPAGASVARRLRCAAD